MHNSHGSNSSKWYKYNKTRRIAKAMGLSGNAMHPIPAEQGPAVVCQALRNYVPGPKRPVVGTKGNIRQVISACPGGLRTVVQWSTGYIEDVFIAGNAYVTEEIPAWPIASLIKR